MNNIYVNNFGAVNKEHIKVSICRMRKTFSLHSVVKIRFVKRQEYRINSALFLLSLFLLVFLYLNNSWSFIQELLILSLSLLLLVGSYLFKSYHSKFIVYTTNDFTDVAVSRGMSRDAEVLSLKINELLDLNRKTEVRKGLEKFRKGLEKV